MKRIILFTTVLCLLLISCSVEVGKNDNNQSVTAPKGCYSYATYSGSKVAGTTMDTYNWLRVGIEDPDGFGWEMYDYEVYVSLNGATWAITSGTSITVPRNTETFYLKVVAYSICYKDGRIFRCTSISEFTNNTRTSKSYYVQPN